MNNETDQRWGMFAQAARGPVLLITLGTLFALQQAGTLPISRSWPLLIIVIGVMKLLERVLLGPAPYVPPVAAGIPPQGYAQGHAPNYSGPNYRGPNYTAPNPSPSAPPPPVQQPTGSGYSGSGYSAPPPSGPPAGGGGAPR